MKKVIISLLAVVFISTLMGSCKSAEKCAAYTEKQAVETKVKV